MYEKRLQSVYLNSLNVFNKHKIEYLGCFNYDFEDEDVCSVYDKILFFLNNLVKNEFCILNLDKEFDLYHFIKYVTKKKGYKEDIFSIKKFLKTKSLVKNKNIIILLKRSSLFLKLNNEDDKFFKKLIKYGNFKLNFVLFTDKKFDISQTKIRLGEFFSYSIHKVYKEKYINPFSENIKNIKLNIYTNFDVETNLKSKLFNQNEIIETTLLNLTKLEDKKPFTDKPIASWLLCGPSGSGKTEFAKILANSLYGSVNNLLKIDMSEYLEKESVSKLIGASPGYIGYGENTILSEKFNECSSLVILFDEVEKANVGVFDTMLQILDEGKLFMSTGKLLDFTESFIIFTSNLGFSNKSVNINVDKNIVLSELNKHFRVEFLNRINKIIIFNSVDECSYNNILNKFVTLFFYKFNLCLNMNQLLEFDLSKIYCNKIYGSRPLKRFIDNFSNLLSTISRKFTYFSHYDYFYTHNLNNFKMSTIF